MLNDRSPSVDLRWGYRRWWFALLALSALLYFLCLGGGSRLSQPDCWVAQTAREMLATGEWWVPHFAGEIRLQKTPGPYWLAAAITRLRGGDVDAVSIRLPNAAAALLIVMTMTWWCRRNFGARPAIYAGFTLACSLFLLYWSHQGSSDLGVASLCTLAIAALWEADRPRREAPGAMAKRSAAMLRLNVSDMPARRAPESEVSNLKSKIRNPKSLWLLFYAACGLGMLYKGPLPIGVVGFPLIAYVLLWCRWRLPFQLSLPLGLPVFAALWLPWVIYIYVHLGADALYRWRAEFVDRATGELPNVAGHAATVLNYVGYYIPVIAAFVMPWTLSLPHALALPFRRHAPAARAPATFLLVWTASIWLFFTLSVGKENRYILAALPPACALLGVYFSALFRSTRHSVPADLESEIQNPKSKIQNRRALPFACLAIILAVVTGAVGGGFGLLEWARHNQPDAAPMLLWRYIPIGVLLALGFSTAAILYLRRREERAFAAICATMALAWTGTWIWLMPIVGGERPAIEVAAVLQKAELRHVDLYYLGVQDARVIYYSGRHIPRIVSSIEMFRLTGGRRNLPREHEEIGRATVLKLRDTSRSVVFVSGEPEFKLLKRGLDEVGQLEGLPLYEWFHTSGTNAKHRLVLFGNIPPPANW